MSPIITLSILRILLAAFEQEGHRLSLDELDLLQVR